MTAREKVIEAERQVRETLAGIREVIRCPFCEQQTEPGQMLCCPLMGDIADAYLQRLETQQRLDIVHNTIDRLQKAVLN